MNCRIIYIWVCVTVLFADETMELLARLTSIEVNKLWNRCRSNGDNHFNVNPTPNQRVERSTIRNNQTNNMPRFLMGGINVKQIEAPFAVHLQYRKRGISSSCAGTMISDRHILTAAHCFINKDCERGTVSEIFSARKWKVYYGGGCLPFAKDTCSKFQQMARSIYAQNIIIPANYLSGPCLHNDIAIVITRLRMVPLNAVACVAQSYDIIPNTFILYSRGSDPTRMKKVTSLAKINVTRIACIQEKSIPQDQICTSEMQKSNMCSGDSGSGLMFKAVNGSWNIVGIASAGTDCRMINMAINLRKEPSNVFQLDGSIFIDVRAHNDFICQYSGLCFGEQLKNRQKIKAILL